MSLSITASLGSKVGQYMRGNSQEPKPGPIHERGTIHERPIHERALYCTTFDPRLAAYDSDKVFLNFILFFSIEK